MSARVLLFADFGKGPVSMQSRMPATVRHAAADIACGRGRWACACGACRYSRTRIGSRPWWLVECESAAAGRALIRAISEYDGGIPPTDPSTPTGSHARILDSGRAS